MGAIGAVGGSLAGAGGRKLQFLSMWVKVEALRPSGFYHILLGKTGSGASPESGRETPRRHTVANTKAKFTMSIGVIISFPFKTEKSSGHILEFQ